MIIDVKLPRHWKIPSRSIYCPKIKGFFWGPKTWVGDIWKDACIDDDSTNNPELEEPILDQ